MPVALLFRLFPLTALLGVAALAFAGCSAPSSPLNVLVLVGDTVRRDALGAYGAGPDRTPTLDILASRGTTFESASAQSSWTQPSVASFLTSRWPHEVTRWDDLPIRLHPGAPTLAEVFRSAGYKTAGFSANVLVNNDNGFARGFDEFWAPPTEASMWTDALATANRVADWLRDHQEVPFLAYVQFIDPHSPYCPPERRPRDPATPVPGDMSRSFFGEDPLPNPERLAEWRSLYAEEIALVDHGVARVLAALSPEVRRRTLVVFLSDHGEEFMEHDFLGHGTTVYEELIGVPLIVAGPGVPPDLRVKDPVALVDLLPTLVALANIDPGAVGREWRGIDLSPAFAGRVLPRLRWLLAETHHYGPLRVSLRRGPLKAVFFNRGNQAPPPVDDALIGEARVRALHPTEAVFDLERDPLETRNLAATEAAQAPLRMARDVLLRTFADSVPGRWVAVRGAGTGGRLVGRIRYSSPLERLVPLFPRPGETISFSDRYVDVSLVDDGSLRAWLAPAPEEPGVVEAEFMSGDLSIRRMADRQGLASATGWVTWQTRAALQAPAVPATEEVEEQQRRLRALGYLR